MPLRTDYPRYPRDVREKQIVSRSALERRLNELHLTGYPSVVNEAALPPSCADETTNTAGAATMTARKPAPNAGDGERPIELMTTNQLVARLAEMARQNARPENEKSPTTPGGGGGGGGGGGSPTAQVGIFDRRSTYRVDYCNKDVPGFHKRVYHIPDYMKNWSETDKSNVEQSKKLPFLTLPDSLLKNHTTVYRHDYLPDAHREDYRLLSHKTNPQDLSVSYAYSAYTINDPVREVKYDKSIASYKSPRCVLWKTHSPRESFVMANRTPEATTEAFRQMRELRSSQLFNSRGAHGTSNGERGNLLPSTNKVLLPGMRGMGYRQAPNMEKDYIYLPRDHFCHQVVYDY